MGGCCVNYMLLYVSVTVCMKQVNTMATAASSARSVASHAFNSTTPGHGHEDSPDDDLVHIHLVRHGETDYNKKRLLQGQLDVPLNATGRAQASDLANCFATTLPCIDAVVCSDLSRARDTCDAIVTALSVVRSGIPLSVRVDAAWRERDMGRLQGMSYGHRESRPAPMAQDDGGESMDAMHTRVVAALTAIPRDLSPTVRHVLVVTHGGVLTCVARHLGISAGSRRNCSVHTISLSRTSGTFRVVAWDRDLSSSDPALADVDGGMM
jgi:probable phosphoglycerate mutase